MEISTNSNEEERVAALENRVRSMDALVRGLVAEMLDLKTVTMAMSRQKRESGSREQEGGASDAPVSPPAVPADDSGVILPEGSQQQDLPAASAEPAMVRIMQADGTMKLEPRFGNKKTF